VSVPEVKVISEIFYSPDIEDERAIEGEKSSASLQDINQM
jgi:hypothetical protein